MDVSPGHVRHFSTTWLWCRQLESDASVADRVVFKKDVPHAARHLRANFEGAAAVAQAAEYVWAGSRPNQVIASADRITRAAAGAANSVLAAFDADGIIPADDVVMLDEGTPHRDEIHPIGVWPKALAGQVCRATTLTLATTRVANTDVMNVHVVTFERNEIPVSRPGLQPFGGRK